MSQSTYIELPNSHQVDATAEVVSFNGRVGTVVSKIGDYSADIISYDPRASGLTNPDTTPAINVQQALDILASEEGSADPTKVSNANYQYVQGQVTTSDATPAVIYADNLSYNGVIMYEARVVGVDASQSIFGTFRRTFTVYVSSGTAQIIDIQSDYTNKQDSSWALTISSNNSTVTVTVKANTGQSVQWVVTLTKTIFKL